MEHFGWTTARAVYVETNPRVSLGLGALGIVLALMGVLLGPPEAPEHVTCYTNHLHHRSLLRRSINAAIRASVQACQPSR